MNASTRRTIHRMHMTLGSLALLALASGCGGERRPAQPVTGTPTFESEVPHDEMPYDVDEQPPPGAGPGYAPAPGSGATGRSPAEEGRTYGDREREAPGGIDEHALCEQLAAATSVSAEDIPGGVQIVMTPSPGASATSLDTLARQLDAHLGAIGQARQEPPGDVGTRCRLFDMARTGARGRVVEAADGLRVLFTSPDPEEVSILREQARQFERSARGGQLR
ncbi:hypothetical protein [Sorangium sp. So ce233]|uniref:hypothetical protein n=1 Tax=Sorangium sp. So ce233 TaxID=3133290 RepID=UPI003F609713